MGDWNTTFLGKRERAVETKTFTFARPRELAYRPGQFFFLSIPDGNGEWLLHHFSFSSSPSEDTVEFTTRMTGHDFKNRVDALEPGTSVRVAGPDGDFVLRPDMTKVAYVCGGVGVTPVRSTIRWAVDTAALVDIVLLYANRNRASTAFREEFEVIGSERIRILDVLSEPGPGWTGLRGHIDADLVREQVPDWRERHFYVSGPPGMTRALSGMLAQEVAVAEDHLTVEYFPGYS